MKHRVTIETETKKHFLGIPYSKGYKAIFGHEKTLGTLIFLGSYWRRSRDLKLP